MARRPRKLGYEWHLRLLMAKQGMFQTTDLAGPLAERGVALSPAQVHRLVTGKPERLNVQVLVALCDILDCTPSDLIEPVARPATKRASAAAGGGQQDRTSAPRNVKPKRARIVPDKKT